MLPVVLAWTVLGTAIAFVVAMLVAILAGSSLGPQGTAFTFWAGVASLGLAIVVAVSILVLPLVSTDSRSDS